MEQKILLRYGEIGLKSDFVREMFEKRLIENIRKGVKLTLPGKFLITKERGRIFLDTSSPEKIYPLLKRIFGIVSFSPCVDAKPDIKSISDTALEMIKRSPRIKTFAVKARRHGIHDFTSQEIKEKAGEKIAKSTGLKVNLSEPDRTVFVEVRDKKAYLYTEKIKAPGGLPLGTQGKVLALIENKSSLLAAWMLMKRGCFVIPVFKRENKKYLSILKEWSIGHDLMFYKVSGFSKNSLKKITEREKASCLVTSETLDRMKFIKKFRNFLVFTPLIGLSNKETNSFLKRIENF